MKKSKDIKTAQAFASSWNNLPEGSVYTEAQFNDWMEPLTADHIRDKEVLELGCGNASLLWHVLNWQPASATGIDLGDSVASALKNLGQSSHKQWNVKQEDLVTYRHPGGADLVYCIGVLHHLSNPEAGFRSVLANTRPGGRFHCWVYAREGNLLVRIIVEPLRKLCCRLPWWLTKYGFATPLSIPVFMVARMTQYLPASISQRLPLGTYLKWLGKREWAFARHVVFDQLVTPQTAYIDRPTIEAWLASHEIDPASTYIVFRNRNSWKFGGSVFKTDQTN